MCLFFGTEKAETITMIQNPIEFNHLNIKIYSKMKFQNSNKKRCTTMAISNCLFSPTSENPCGFSVWCVLVKLSAKPRNYS